MRFRYRIDESLIITTRLLEKSDYVQELDSRNKKLHISL